jgi:hypothetical protein
MPALRVACQGPRLAHTGPHGNQRVSADRADSSSKLHIGITYPLHGRPTLVGGKGCRPGRLEAGGGADSERGTESATSLWTRPRPGFFFRRTDPGIDPGAVPVSYPSVHAWACPQRRDPPELQGRLAGRPRHQHRLPSLSQMALGFALAYSGPIRRPLGSSPARTHKSTNAAGVSLPTVVGTPTRSARGLASTVAVPSPQGAVCLRR